MVPMGGLEPPWTTSTTPSRWRVYQFHHIGVSVCLYGNSGRSAGASLVVSVIAVLVILSTLSVFPEK